MEFGMIFSSFCSVYLFYWSGADEYRTKRYQSLHSPGRILAAQADFGCQTIAFFHHQLWTTLNWYFRCLSHGNNGAPISGHWTIWISPEAAQSEAKIKRDINQWRPRRQIIKWCGSIRRTRTAEARATALSIRFRAIGWMGEIQSNSYISVFGYFVQNFCSVP